MASIIIFTTVFGVSAIGYGVFSAVKAHRNKKERSNYKKNVIRFTVKNKNPLQSNYNKIKNSLLFNSNISLNH
jgi:hypothetical protein